MVYSTFLETIRHSLQQLLGNDFAVMIHPIPKNNGMILDGLSIRQTDSPISPTIYLNSYYEQYLNGMTLDEITDDILALYLNHPAPDCIIPEQITRIDLIREKIMFKVIHAASNQELLCNIPHIPYLDLAIVFYLFLERNETGQITALIYNEHLALWQITARELLDLSLLNTPKIFPAVLKSMDDVMKEMAKESMGEAFDEELVNQLLKSEEPLSPLYVLTNSSSLHGAGCMIYQNVLKDFANSLGTDLLILPSSIHEVLLTPDHSEVSYEELSAMVTCINQNEVPAEDQLSNQVYLYSRQTDSVKIVTSSDELVGIHLPTPS